MKKFAPLLFCFGITWMVACGQTSNEKTKASQNKTTEEGFEVKKSSEEWQTCLTAEQYKVLREKGTERAFTGKFYNHKEKGIYICVGCGTELFSSDTKFDSGTGWPSYWQPVAEGAVKTNQDISHGMVRDEVVCGKCGGHLGHVFDDGPDPTGMRYCINSAALDFKAKEEANKKKAK